MSFDSRPEDNKQAEDVLASGRFRTLQAHVAESDPTTLAHQIELTEIPAPPFGEQARAERMRSLLTEAGAADARLDAIGNVVARYADPGAPSGPPVVLAAHLDTVFPAGTDVSVTRDGDLLKAPGISDNGRGLAALLTCARSMGGARVALARPVLFVATVGEEGIGDLRGARFLFSPDGAGHGAAACIALDGAGRRSIVNRGLGARRLRVDLIGPGGHSWTDWGRANPIHALSRGLAALQDLPLPKGTTLSVGRVGGGRSVNAIPQGAWAELEIRSEDEARLETMRPEVLGRIEAAVAQANGARAAGSDALFLETTMIGARPAGATPEEAAIVRAAAAATYALGDTPRSSISSTDANVPMALGIPAITLGAGGEAGQAHTTEEWYRNARGPRGITRALLALMTLDRMSAP